MTVIYWVRHAEAEGNIYLRSHGSYDSDLSERGWKQLKALEKRFRDIHLDAVYCSDQFRAVATAKAVAGNKDLPLRKDSRLRELDTGEWENMTWGDIYFHDPVRYACFFTRPELYAPPAGGETFVRLKQRVFACLQDIIKECPNKTVAVVSHGTATRILLGYLDGLSFSQVGKSDYGGNTSVTLLEAEDGVIRVPWRYDTSHLSEALSSDFIDSQLRGDKLKQHMGFRFVTVAPDRDRKNFLPLFKDMAQNGFQTVAGTDPEVLSRRADFVSEHDPQAFVWAMQDKERAGFVLLDPVEGKKENTGYVLCFYLKPEYRGHSRSYELLGYAVSYFRSAGRSVLKTHCARADHSLQLILNKMGFYRAGDIMAKDISCKYRNWDQ